MKKYRSMYHGVMEETKDSDLTKLIIKSLIDFNDELEKRKKKNKDNSWG